VKSLSNNNNNNNNSNNNANICVARLKQNSSCALMAQTNTVSVLNFTQEVKLFSISVNIYN